jgi:hypothetical protein
MNWPYFSYYFVTRIVAALCIFFSGWYLALGDVFLSLVGLGGAGLVWFAWKWIEEGTPL